MTTIRLFGESQRTFAHQCIEKAIKDSYVTIKPPTRSTNQNALFWSLLGDVSKAEPMVRKHTPDDWKCIFMRALDYEVRFILGLDNNPFPVGFRSSKMTVEQMNEMIEYIYWFTAKYEVPLSLNREDYQ